MSHDPLSSPSKNGLRLFRFQKKPVNKLGSDESSKDFNDSVSGDDLKIGQRGGRIQIPDSEDENSPLKGNGAVVGGLKGLVQLFPHMNALVIEKFLLQCQGDFSSAKQMIETHIKNGGSPNSGDVVKTVNSAKPNLVVPVEKRKLSPQPEANGRGKVKRFKKIRVNNDSDCSGSDSDSGNYKKEERRVFDSDDDSDAEVSNDATKEQKEVLEFLSTATLAELLCMPQISRKKADAILELRPFEGWRDMVDKFQQSKGISCDILNSAQDFLYTRQVVTQLMLKCSKLSQDLERFNTSGLSIVPVQPSLLSSELTLAPYQMVGLNWMVMLHRKGLNGILADEMGLGKTVQIISFLAWLKQNYGADSDPNLIVVPSSTLDNWKNELERWCPTLKVLVYYGDKDERKAIRASTLAAGLVKQFDVILTTYNLLTASPEEKKMFKVLHFRYVVFDEAHMLKNMKTARYEQLSQVNASRRLLLTGTPLQNSLLELMSLLTFVMPEMFKNKKEYLKCLFTKTKEKGDSPETENSEVLPRFEQEQVAQAKKIMKPFVLRRLKKDVLKDLPTKTDIIKKCDMVDRQRAMYDNLIQTYSKSASNEKVEDEISGMGMMMQLRKVANHPLMVRELYQNKKLPELAKILVKEPDYKEKNLDYVVEDLGILSDFEIHNLCKTFPKLHTYKLKDDDILESGKFKLLDELIPQLKSGNHRLLIFSQFVTMLNILEAYLDIRGLLYLRLDGSTPVPIRQELIDTFNSDPNITVFLLSTRAGGLGINLTAADTVLIHDLDFNPYNDKQAEDRCHRVGQVKPVTVYRLVSSSSIEEDIQQIASDKLHLEKEISAEDKDIKETKQLLKKALGLDQTTSPTKKSS